MREAGVSEIEVVMGRGWFKIYSSMMELCKHFWGDPVTRTGKQVRKHERSNRE